LLILFLFSSFVLSVVTYLSAFFHWHTGFISFYLKKTDKSPVPINTLLIAAVITIKIM
jgi:hypothetical protein